MKYVILALFTLMTSTAFAQREYTTGFVRYYNESRGYGFIIPIHDLNDEVFVHKSMIHRSGLTTLVGGDCVEFERVKDARTGKVTAAFISKVDLKLCKEAMEEYESGL